MAVDDEEDDIVGLVQIHDDDDDDDDDDEEEKEEKFLEERDVRSRQPEIPNITTPVPTAALLYSRDDEKLDINATMEHLIVTGNYYRHQQWRISEWERNETLQQQPLQLQQHSNNNKSSHQHQQSNREDHAIDDNSNKTGMTTRKRHKRNHGSIEETNDSTTGTTSGRSSRRSEETTTPSTHPQPHLQSQQHILHAQDARLYNPNNDRHDGMEPDLWPKPPYTMAKEAPLSDQRWEEELSDAIHPMVLSRLRLSDVLPSIHEMENDDGEMLLGDTTENTPVAAAARVLLLHCWERAVHAAATTMTLNVAVSPQQQPPPPQNSVTRTTSASASLHSGYTNHHPNNTSYNIRNSKKRTREEAIWICQQLQIQECQPPPPPEKSSSSTSSSSQPPATMATNSPTQLGHRNVVKYQCSSCHLEFTTKELLHDHFYGNDSIDEEGCGWWSIDEKRRTITASILENEVKTLSQQLVRHIMFHPDQLRHSISLRNKNINHSSDASSSVNGFDVLQLMQQDLLTSRKIASTGRNTSANVAAATATSINHNSNHTSCLDENVVFETLEVSMHESSIPVNDAVIEAVRNRLIDRYGKIPR